MNPVDPGRCQCGAPHERPSLAEPYSGDVPLAGYLRASAPHADAFGFEPALRACRVCGVVYMVPQLGRVRPDPTPSASESSSPLEELRDLSQRLNKLTVGHSVVDGLLLGAWTLVDRALGIWRAAK